MKTNNVVLFPRMIALSEADVRVLVSAARQALCVFADNEPELFNQIHAARRRVRYALDGDPRDAPAKSAESE